MRTQPILDKALELRPDDSGVYLELGIAYEGLDKIDKAVSAYQTAVRLAPQSTEAQSRLSKYSEKQRIRE
jgi:Flp pilus assembly protein TadD